MKRRWYEVDWRKVVVHSAIGFVWLLIGLLLFSSCTSTGDMYSVDTGLGSSNTSPLHISYTNSLLVSLNQTDLTGWSGLLSDDQHVLDSEVLSALSNNTAKSINALTDINGRIDSVLYIDGERTSGTDGIAIRQEGVPLYTISRAGLFQMEENDIFQPKNDNSGYLGWSDKRWANIFGYTCRFYNQEIVSYIQMEERTAPGSGSADTARIYAFQGVADNLTDLNAVFQDGTIVTFAEESTPCDSPIFRYGDDTEVKYKMFKPNPGLIQFAAVFPDGSSFILKSIEYHDADKIAVSQGAKMPLPADWIVETKEEREARIRYENLLEETKLLKALE